ncbi:MAG: protein-glutamate O-methyltransferase CheR [Chloroflexota bacterium]|nr:protein-glutamate O-methyltransferase CheR [Chloroflexota bacterium]
MNDMEYQYTKKKVRELLDIDLENYKEQQMRRRLTSFVDRSKAPDVGTYFTNAEKNNQMLKELQDFLTINVSEFFRDERQFGKLETVVMPELLKNNSKLKIWSAGCSIGAEPYTLAIMLTELSPDTKHQIVASDLDNTILSHAKAGGPYSDQDVKNVSPQRLTKYFTKKDDEYWVIDSIKNKVDFKRHNLLTDIYEKQCDLILCRNVVIYFTDAAKLKINQGFLDSLKDGGVLFVGGSEIIFDSAKLGFESIIPSFYRRKPSGTTAHRPMRK